MNIWKRAELNMANKFIRTFAFLLFIIFVLSGILFVQVRLFKPDFYTKFTRQSGYAFDYFVKPGKEQGYTLYICDLTGLNPVAYKKCAELVKKTEKNDSSILVIPGLVSTEHYYEPFTTNSFFDHITNSNSIVIHDNFCAPDWEKIKEKAMYKESLVSPGSFCASEPETVLVDSIIKKYNVKKVVLSTDISSGQEFFVTFLSYLKVFSIPYEIIRTDQINF